MEEKNPDQTKELSYDLRQIYAVGIVGLNFQLAQEAWEHKNYDSHLRFLRRVHTVIAHNFKKPLEDEEEYRKLVTQVKNLANKYPQVFCGIIKKANECEDIELTLEELEMFLYKKCDEANLFGGKIERDPSKIIGSSR
jgi:hypothetical protein